MYLNAHSWFSFKYGVMKPYALLEEAAKAGVRSFALTDIHCTAGIPDFVRDAMRYFNIRPVAGIEFRAGARLLYIGLAKNNNGFQRLNELLSPHLLDDEVLPERAPELEDVFFIYPMQNAPQRLRPNERVGIRPWELTRLPFSPFHNGVRCRPQDLVALLPVTLRNKVDHNVHRLLRTVAKNTVLSMLPPEELAQPDEVFRSEAEVRHLYRDFPQLLENAQRLLDACDIAFDGSDKTWKVLGASAAEDREKLHRDTLAGMAYRYPNASAQVKARVQHELKVIEDMGYISYFLINQDIVEHARRRGFFHVGRGSGANSVVAYCLRITDVDPMELDLYFERFINPARKKPPDFDIDFSWKDRDEIFRHVFGKYNTPGASGIHAAQIATYTTFQWRGAVRELGKAMGLPPAEIDALSEGDAGYFSRGKPSANVKNGELDRVARAVVRYGKELLGMPHHLGIHAGGVVITDKPVTHFTALYRPPKGFPVTQFSMLEAEDLGLHKFDLLSQRGLGHIRDAVELVNKTQDTRHKFQGSNTEDVQLVRHETCDFREAAVELVNKTQETRHKFQGSSIEDVQLDVCDLRHETCDFREAAVELVNKTQETRYKFQGSSIEDVQLDVCDLRHETCDFREAAVGLVNKTQDTRHKFQGSNTEDVQLDVCDLRHETCDFREAAVDIHDIQRFKQDPAIKELIRRGDTIGCFYVESPAMRMLLKKLEVDDYLGLVAASSIIRPGVAESGMMREYLLRHRDPERRKLAPERMMAIMPETYGVMVYQEDVMRVVVQYAGLTAEEADQVRRGMNIRYRDRPEFKVVERKFFDNCRERGYPNGEAEEVWRQIQSFASFSFAKGHSASYAVESYQSLYLKAHHPLEFLVGVVNNFGGFYHTEFYLHEAKRAGAVIEAPCVNRSEELCTLQKGVGQQQGYVTHAAHNGASAPRIFLGLGNVKSLNEASVALILNERRKNGPYADLEDLLKRVPLGLEQARILVRVGALRCTGRSKPQLLWDVALLHRPATVRTSGDLFITKVEEPRLPELQHYALADAYDELDLLGFPLCDPFELVDLSEATAQDQPPIILKRDMAAHVGKRVRMLGYMIHVKATDTHHGQRMTFGSFIDPAGDFWDSTQFPDVAAQYTFRGRGVYRFIGVVEEEFGHTSLRTERLEKLPWRPDPRYGDG